jgi:hypothetical protein
MKYYVMTHPNKRGDHVVHREDCQFVPNPENRKALGEAASCDTAVRRAAAEFDPVKGCGTCAPDCA